MNVRTNMSRDKVHVKVKNTVQVRPLGHWS